MLDTFTNLEGVVIGDDDLGPAHVALHVGGQQFAVFVVVAVGVIRLQHAQTVLGAALFGHEKYRLRCHFELPIGCLQASVIACFLLLKVKLQIQLKITTAIQGT